MSSSPADVARGQAQVTAVIVAHDGARWLPDLLSTLERQSRLPDRLVAVDTGSRDDTAEILCRALGTDAVVTTERHLGFGAALAAGLRAVDGEPATAATRGPAGEAEHWVWVLHDDMQLAPDALANLLAAAARDPGLSVVGPKVREWPRRRRLLETGLTVTGTARRLTGVERGEYDQGQHDRLRDALAVGSAGMLVRRTDWDRLDGFDPALPLFADDLDLGWRAARAGLRSAVTPDAVVYHAEAAARGRRRVDAAPGRPRRVAREHTLYTVLVNCRAWAVAPVAIRLLLGSLLRALGLLLLKAPRQAWDELVAVTAALCRPARLWRGRRRRRDLPRRPATAVRRLLPPWWAPYAHGLELLGQVVAEAADAVADRTRRGGRDLETGPVPEEAQNLTAEAGALSTLLRRTLSRPIGLVVVALATVSLLAAPDVLGPGRLQGGALLPAPPGAGDWWRTYAESWHPVALGSDVPAPPYVAVLAAVGTLLLGKAWLVVDLLLVLAVPLAAAGAYASARSVVRSRAVAAWAAAAYGLLPVLTGALGQGRLGTLVAAVVLPLLVHAFLGLVRTRTRSRGGARWRAVAGAGLLLAALAAFVPVALPTTLLAGAGYWLATDRGRDLAGRLAATGTLAVLLLLPWLLHLSRDPGRWLSAEAGFAAGVPTSVPSAGWELLLGRPGGPAQAPGWVTAGLVLAAVMALLRTDRRPVVLTAWGVGLLALATAVVQQHAGAWPGFAVLVAQAAAVVAAAAGADGALDRLGGATFGWRQPVAAAVAGTAVLAPVLGAGWWLLADGQSLLHREAPLALPAYIADAQLRRQAPRTLLVAGSGAGLSVHLSRGPGLFLGQAAVAGRPPGALTDLAARLVSEPTEDDVTALARQGVGFVLLRGAGATAVAAVDGAPGLVRASAGDQAGTAWRLDRPAGPVRVLGASGAPAGTAVLPAPTAPAAPAVNLPPGAPGRTLSLGEAADDDWVATLDGAALAPRVVHGWSQGFTLPGQGGRLVVEHEAARAWWLAGQATVLLLAVVLVAPGRRRTDAAL